MKALEKATEDKPLEKAPIVVPYDDGYDANADPSAFEQPAAETYNSHSSMSLDLRLQLTF